MACGSGCGARGKGRDRSNEWGDVGGELMSV